MQYYTLKYAVDTEETGHVFPQIDFSNPKKLNPQPVLLANKATHGKYPPDNILPFDYLQLNKGAKLTDLMSSPFINGFIISERLKTILEQGYIKDYKIYDIVLLDSKKQEVKGYYYFHSASCLREHVDYKKSKFYIGTMLQKHIRDLQIVFNDFSDLEKLKENLPFGEEFIWPKQFWLKPSFPYQLELYRLSVLNTDFFINESLKQKLLYNNITGIDIKPVEDFIKTPNLA